MYGPKLPVGVAVSVTDWPEHTVDGPEIEAESALLFTIVKVALGGLEQKQPAFVSVHVLVSFPSAEASKMVFKLIVVVD